MVKGAVCKTAMQRFDPARRLQTSLTRAAGHLFAVSSSGPPHNDSIGLPESYQSPAVPSGHTCAFERRG